MTTTKEQLAAGLQIVRAVADTIREVGTAPRGVIYTALMSKGLSLANYEQIEGMLVRAGLVRVDSEQLVWIA